MEKISFGILFGSIFGGVGAVFTIIGLIMTANIDALINSPNSSGDVRILPIVFTGMGLLFVAIGVPFIVIDIKKNIAIKKAIAAGYYIYAKVVEIRPNYNVRINGRHPYVLECQYEDPSTGAIHVFVSGSMMYAPEQLLDTDVKVWVDRNNYGIYKVDLEGVNKKVYVH